MPGAQADAVADGAADTVADGLGLAVEAGTEEALDVAAAAP